MRAPEPPSRHTRSLPPPTPMAPCPHRSDVCKRAANMWDLSTAWAMATGSFGLNEETVVSIKEGPAVTAIRDDKEANDAMQQSLFELYFPQAHLLEYHPVFEGKYMGLLLRPEMWVLTETWISFLESSNPMLAVIDEIVRISSGELFVRLMSLKLQVAALWVAETRLELDTAALHAAPRENMLFPIDQLVFTMLEASGDGLRTSFSVQRSLVE